MPRYCFWVFTSWRLGGGGVPGPRTPTQACRENSLCLSPAGPSPGLQPEGGEESGGAESRATPSPVFLLSPSPPARVLGLGDLYSSSGLGQGCAQPQVFVWDSLEMQGDLGEGKPKTPYRMPLGKRVWLGSHNYLLPVLNLLPNCCVTWGELLAFSGL